jgi:CDP-glucose 4,6-dehydratase
MRATGWTWPNAYQGRRVLVTGHTGFKGGWLCTWLLKLGASVTGVALPPSDQPNLFDALRLGEDVASHEVDIRDWSAVQRIFVQAEPEIVFHLAAQPLVRRSYADPIETFATNVLGTAHVLEASRGTSSVRAVVSVTTDKVYENKEWLWPYRETDRLGGLDPYSASKACAELISNVYQKTLCCHDRRRIEIATARGGNVVGGGDWSADRIVPDIVRALIADQPITLRNPQAVRPWQHVLELCEGYLELGARLLTSNGAFAEAWNFGPRPESDMTVLKLTRALLTAWQRPSHPVEVHASSLKETQRLRLDISKSTSHLDWRPRLSIAETIDLTARWYRRFYREPASARALTLDQIGEFIPIMPERAEQVQ